MSLRKDYLQDEARKRNAERREMAAHKGYCPNCGAGPTQPEGDPADSIRVFRCGECRYIWTVTS
jgi:hypothetical protein